MAKLISRDITLSYKTGEASEYIELIELQEIPDLGGEVEKIECTTLSDKARVFTQGLISYGDSLAFKFYYGEDKEQFMALNSLDGTVDWKVTLGDGTTCTFSGECSVKLDGTGIGNMVSYTLSIAPNSEMIWG